MIKPQAREIVRYAKRNGITIKNNRVAFPNLCARGVLAHSVLTEKGVWGEQSIYHESIHQNLGLTEDDLDALETGFEGFWDRPDLLKNRYYKVGQRVATLAGL